MSAANRRQVGGSHYKQFGELQPWDVIVHFKLGFLDGNAVKYLLRANHKGQMIQDLEKAKHYIEKLIETTLNSKPSSRRSSSQGSRRRIRRATKRRTVTG
jgi:Protein of unknwon function (DUF3310)